MTWEFHTKIESFKETSSLWGGHVVVDDEIVQAIKGEKITADANYILESIRNPNAKVVTGFPENYMPPYQLKDKQAKALLLYLKSLKKN